jgi:hypothetical protein
MASLQAHHEKQFGTGVIYLTLEQVKYDNDNPQNKFSNCEVKCESIAYIYSLRPRMLNTQLWTIPGREVHFSDSSSSFLGSTALR